MYTASFVAASIALAGTVSAFDCSGPYFSFYNRPGRALSYQRVDPALFPGAQSPHLHSFDGGNALSDTMGFDTTQESTCTTARIKPDKSLYWRPTLFWNGNNTGFYRVPEKFTKIYYKFMDGNERANVTEFPEDFHMIAGYPDRRSEEEANPGAMKWACLGENYARIDSAGFPTGFTSCKEGLTTEITFPSCWNGKALDPNDAHAHMAYPGFTGKGVEACPEGFRTARFPTIFIEFWYDISPFDGQYTADSTPWVLSNGDTTGHSFHADFLNGWEKGVLAKATAETGYCNCGCGCGNDQMKECFGPENVNDDGDEEFKSCTVQSVYAGEDKSPVDQLPGSNSAETGAGDATAATHNHKRHDKEDTKGGDHGDDYAAPSPSTSSAVPASASSLGPMFTDITTIPPSLRPTAPLDPFVISSSSCTESTTTSPKPTPNDCQPAVTITVTPTVTVTAGSQGMCVGTVYKTVTDTATVTVSEDNSNYDKAYQHKKRHVQVHAHGLS